MGDRCATQVETVVRIYCGAPSACPGQYGWERPLHGRDPKLLNLSGSGRLLPHPLIAKVDANRLRFACGSDVVPEPVARTAWEALRFKEALKMCVAEILQRFKGAKLRRGSLANVVVESGEATTQKVAGGITGRPQFDQVAAEVAADTIDARCATPLTLQHSQSSSVWRASAYRLLLVRSRRSRFHRVPHSNQAGPLLTMRRHGF